VGVRPEASSRLYDIRSVRVIFLWTRHPWLKVWWFVATEYRGIF
jgi:hypothetical protein